MKAEVLKTFRDKNSKEFFPKDGFFEGNAERIKELQKKGYIGEVVDDGDGSGGSGAKEENHDNNDDILSVLDGSVEEVKADTDGLKSEELKDLLEAEKSGKARKGVIEYFEAMIEVVEGEPKEGE